MASPTTSPESTTNDPPVEPLYLPRLNTYIDHTVLPPTSHSASTDDHPRQLHLCIVPGNPGLLGYYIPMAKYLHQLTHGQYHIHIVSYAGFGVQSYRKNKALQQTSTAMTSNALASSQLGQTPLGYNLYGLEHQVLALEEALQVLQQQARPARVEWILLGHSIGSYLLTQLQYRYWQRTSSTASDSQHLTILHTFLLFPFIRFDLPIALHESFNMTFRLRYLTYALGWVLRYAVPRSILRWIMPRMIPDLREPHALKTTLGMILSGRMVRQWLHLGKTEFEYLPSKTYEQQFPTMMSTIQRRATLFYASRFNDHWCPITTAQEWKQTYKYLDVRQAPECTHAFCVQAHMYNSVASTIAQKLPQIVDGQENVIGASEKQPAQSQSRTTSKL